MHGPSPATGIRPFLTRWFDLDARGVLPRRELLAGFTTFGSMSYILMVNPLIMAGAGMDKAQMITATAAAAMIGTLIMALWANIPVALAPSMIGNVMFSQVVVQKLGLSYQTGLAMVFVSGLLFLGASLAGWREKIVRGFPEPIRLGIQASLGIFIGWIGLKNAGLITVGASGVGFTPLTDPATIFAFGALLLTLVLVGLKIPAGLLLSIIAITIAGLLVPGRQGGMVTQLPDQFLAIPVAPRDMAFSLDFMGLLQHLPVLLPVILYFCLTEFFGVAAALMGVMRRTGLMQSDGTLEGARGAYCADGIATAAGSLLGTSTISIYVESATGVEAGGRTGLTALTVALLFALSTVTWPLLVAIPMVATAPALVVVGALMLQGVADLKTGTAEESMPPLLMVIVTACTTDLMMSMVAGLLTYSAIVIVKRQREAITALLIGLDLTCFAYILVASRLQ